MIEATVPIEALTAPLSARPRGLADAKPLQGLSFEQILRQGIEATDSKIERANQLAVDFVIDGSVPAHQVTYALEEARLSLELMIQVRNRLLEGYQQMMNMQV